MLQNKKTLILSTKKIMKNKQDYFTTEKLACKERKEKKAATNQLVLQSGSLNLTLTYSYLLSLKKNKFSRVPTTIY